MKTKLSDESADRMAWVWNLIHYLALLGAGAAGLLFPAMASAQTQAQARERSTFNSGWRFAKGDPAEAAGKLEYASIKDWILPTGAEYTSDPAFAGRKRPAGNPGGLEVSYAKLNFDDSQWRLLNLPHDWGIEGPFKQESPGETGKLPWWGVAWYRKHLYVPVTDKERRLYLDVDGAMAYASVWVNGKLIGGWPYGYASWRVDLTPHLRVGDDNIIAIRLDNPPDSSRWYPGGGIYRNVWLVKTAPVHVAKWGTYITTPEVSQSAAGVRIEVLVDNDGSADTMVSVKNELFEIDDKGNLGKDAVASVKTERVKVPAGKSQPVVSQVTFRDPRLWSTRTPYLYVAVTTLLKDGDVVDSCETPFGIRTIRFGHADGFVLNGERVPLQGVCNHHDLGALGSAINVRALERQLEILQEMGCNAIRTSHNPPAPELLDLCDRMGFVVMDEAFDCWAGRKKPNDYAKLFPDWHEKDWRAQIRRDRNHPCVILWSTGNEIREQGSMTQTNGHVISEELTRIAHEEDPTRPATAGCNNVAAGFNGFQKTIDVFGYNYKPQEYGRFRQANPNQPLYGSETASCVSSRGEYFFPVSTNKADGRADFQVSSYDLYAPRWAMPPDTEFHGQDRFPFVAGEFVWTGFDYLGEPTPYNADVSNLLNYTDPAEKERAEKELREIGKIRVPSRSSYFGIIDLAGFKKDRFYIYQARWRPDLRMAHILPHWNWPERVGQVTPVHVYTSGDEAELFLDGKSLGRKKKGEFEYRLQWDDVQYQPGELKVVAYRRGKRWATDTMKTTGPAAKLLLDTDRSNILADGKDLAFVTVQVSDKEGLLVPRSKNKIRFEVEGPAEIIATDNGDPTSFESFQSPERNAFNGLCLAIVRSVDGRTGTIQVHAYSDGLKSDTVAFKSTTER